MSARQKEKNLHRILKTSSHRLIDGISYSGKITDERFWDNIIINTLYLQNNETL